MKSTIELAYLGVEVPEPDSLTSFFGDVIGLVPGQPTTDGARTWRNDTKAQRIIVRSGPANDAAFLGFEAVDDVAFDEIVGRLRSVGGAVVEATAADAAARRVRRLATTLAPWGVPVEIVTGLEAATTPFDSPLMPGGFLTEGVGFGHVVFSTRRHVVVRFHRHVALHPARARAHVVILAHPRGLPAHVVALVHAVGIR